MKIKLTESKLKQIVNESVKKVLKEYNEHNGTETYNDDYDDNYEEDRGTGQVLIDIATNGADIELEGDDEWCEEIFNILNLKNYHANVYINDRLVN